MLSVIVPVASTAPIEFTNYRTIRIRNEFESDRIVYLDS